MGDQPNPWDAFWDGFLNGPKEDDHFSGKRSNTIASLSRAEASLVGTAKSHNADKQEKGRLRLSVEYDSEDPYVVAKASGSLLDGAAKLKATVFAALDGRLRAPMLSAVLGRDLHISHDLETGSTLCLANVGLGEVGSLALQHDSEARRSSISTLFKPSALVSRCLHRQQGKKGQEGKKPESAEESLGASATAELVLDSHWKPKTTLPAPLPSLARLGLFLPPFGQVQFVPRVPCLSCNGEEGEHDHPEPSTGGFSGSFRTVLEKAQKGRSETCLTCDFATEPAMLSVGLRKKAGMLTIAPRLSLTPQPSLEFAFKRRFDPTHKVSMLYSVADAAFTAVYKCTPQDTLRRQAAAGDGTSDGGEDVASQHMKMKLGYDSRIRLFWSSLWVGSENEGASKAPWKTKAQVMVQVPQEANGLAPSFRDAVLMLRVKKRVDLF